MGDDCCEPLPQSVGVKKGLGLGLRLSLSKPRRSQSKSDDCSESLSQSQGKFNLLANLSLSIFKSGLGFLLCCVGNNIHLNPCKRHWVRLD